MLLEPPGQDVPPRHLVSATDRLRLGAAAAALALTLLSRGDALVLAGLLGLVAWRPLRALGGAVALGAGAWRFGSMGLSDLAGAQAVLGPAVVVGPTASAAGSWLAAVAIVACAPRDGPARPLLVLATGAAAGTVLAGPAPGDWFWTRPIALVGATGVAYALSRLPDRPLVRQALDVVAAAAGTAAVLVVAPDAGVLSRALDGSAVVEGAAVAAAVALLVVTAAVGTPRAARRARPAPRPAAPG